MTTPVVVTAADIATVRGMIAETTLTDIQIAERIAATVDDDGAINHARAAARIWGEKAADLADMVDVNEGGSSRKLSDLHKHALAMASHWAAVAGGGAGVVAAPMARARTRAIVRE